MMSWMALPRWVFAVLLTILFSLSHAAEGSGRRIALVIGNGAYQQAIFPKLPNPTNDAEDVAKSLRSFGFEVIERKNQTLEGMNKAIAEFGRKIVGSDAALFYYSGHGLQVKNQNYLIPVNASIDSESTVPYQAVNMNQILDEMDTAGSKTNIVFLDACRNNPITGKFRSGQSRGLATPSAMPKGTVIVYATDPGNVADDGSGRNGLFTAGLLSAFKGRDLTLDGVLTTASEEVERTSDKKQTPYVNGPKTLQKNFSFRVTIEPGALEMERTFWKSIESSTNIADFEAYLTKYPQGAFRQLAENRRNVLAGTALTVQAGTNNRFDGRWMVTIICDSTNVKGGPAKGYKVDFFTIVENGVLKGQSGEPGKPGAFSLTGQIQNNGEATIFVKGLTGNPDLTVGHLQQGSSFAYRMNGMFSETKGNATRLEVRPCKAAFSKD